jgi:hypothetical protein
MSALVEQLITDYSIDPNRVYATGFSAGGYLSNYLGNNLSDKIAAIAPVEAGILSPWTLSKPPRGVPACIVHNRFDEVVPYASGIETRDRWITWNETSSTAQQITLNDDPPVLLELYKNGRDFSEVAFYTVEYTYYKGHGWAWKEYTGLDATAEAIWPFFNKYSLKGLPTGFEETGEPAGIHVFPNPVTEGRLYLSFTADAPCVIYFAIHDLAGKLLCERTLSGQHGRNHVPVRIPELGPGMYLLSIYLRDRTGSYRDMKYTGKITVR